MSHIAKLGFLHDIISNTRSKSQTQEYAPEAAGIQTRWLCTSILFYYGDRGWDDLKT